MGVEYRAERGLLATDEIAPVERSHFPQLETLPREELLDLARWLRARRARAAGPVLPLEGKAHRGARAAHRAHAGSDRGPGGDAGAAQRGGVP